MELIRVTPGYLGSQWPSQMTGHHQHPNNRGRRSHIMHTTTHTPLICTYNSTYTECSGDMVAFKDGLHNVGQGQVSDTAGAVAVSSVMFSLQHCDCCHQQRLIHHDREDEKLSSSHWSSENRLNLSLVKNCLNVRSFTFINWFFFSGTDPYHGQQIFLFTFYFSVCPEISRLF